MKRQYLAKAMAAGFILSVLFSFVGFNSICENLECKVLRLHVKANSDTETDQKIKIAVKDEVFTVVDELTSDCTSMEEAERVIRNNLDIIDSTADMCLARLNADYSARAYVDESFFGTRDYGEFTLPAGCYHALRVDLGNAEGENWWCAVYPALCTSSSVKYDSFTENERDLILDNTYEIKFKFYEIYRRLADILSK